MMKAAIHLIEVKNEFRVDSRDLSARLGLQHESVFKLVKEYQADFEEIGILRFEIGEIKGRGQPEKYALLNEDQAYLLLTFSRNTARVRSLKVKLVKAFREIRIATEQINREYFPVYHDLHEQIHTLAAGSESERFAHMNANKLVNKVVGIGPGQRRKLPQATQSLVVVASAVAANAYRGAKDHKEGYARAKEALQPLEACQLTDTTHQK